jgi:hypothetical protein
LHWDLDALFTSNAGALDELTPWKLRTSQAAHRGITAALPPFEFHKVWNRVIRRHGPSYRKVLNHVVQLAMALPPPYERKPLAWQWNRKVRPPAERPAMAPCITVCPFARRPTHFYTFNLAELESEKYSFFAVAAEGCIHCLRQKYDADPHLVHAVSEDRQYTALDYAIW